MKLKERIEFIDKKLDDFYPNPPIPLDHSDPYTLLIAVLLSAQCTDAREHPYIVRIKALQSIRYRDPNGPKELGDLDRNHLIFCQ